MTRTKENTNGTLFSLGIPTFMVLIAASHTRPLIKGSDVVKFEILKELKDVAIKKNFWKRI
jgi:hypothetical protein